MNHILKCIQCQQYTMKSICPSCNSKCLTAKPAKYSPEDKYGDYRRKAKDSSL